ncbi:MAG: tRNA (adenosine(37)-N6)-threonylcarbamoyltransferase complex dimerization subunit type 1 TsaB [Chitinophagaceae bacterium]|nr:MAG: tRNA (adenosine(37)-N6)-threonylcarbamoyltransferase complex dimerization subunit type 1 TsaB [Chitinophagaceae bacterium]
MALLLHIDTAVQSASVCLSDDKNILGELTNASERESASWLHTSIQDLLRSNNLQVKQLNAIAISAGPGSYTGLRVGMAAAKGLCYSHNIPLISINTLQLMAASVANPTTDLLCPMIDARRMEVFTALYNQSLQEVRKPTNLILDENCFEDYLKETSITFFGNGSEKAKPIIQHPNALFASVTTSASSMIALALDKFDTKQFSDLAYTEPLYIKDFHSPISKKNY